MPFHPERSQGSAVAPRTFREMFPLFACLGEAAIVILPLLMIGRHESYAIRPTPHAGSAVEERSLSRMLAGLACRAAIFPARGLIAYTIICADYVRPRQERTQHPRARTFVRSCGGFRF